MPSSRRNTRSRRQDDKRFRGPMDVLIYMLSACSAEWDPDSDWVKRWDFDDDETEITEHSSHSSNRRGTHRRSRSMKKSRNTPRSRSHSLRSNHRSRSLEKDFSDKCRSRSLSRSKSRKGTSSFPTPALDLNKHAEISVYHHDDDMSAISAGTLEQMERIQIIENANKHLNKRQSPNVSTPIVPIESYIPFIQDKENIVNFSSPSEKSENTNHYSSASDGTSEFESIWKPSRPDPSTSATVADNYNHGYDLQYEGRNSYHLSKSKIRSSRIKHASFETPNTRKMRRQIQRDGIGTIKEGMYSDEEEI